MGQMQGHSGSGNPALRSQRLDRGWTADDVAAGLEELAALLYEPSPRVDASLVRKWERGTRVPGRYYGPRLCLLFGVAPLDLGLAPSPRLIAECRRLSGLLDAAIAARLSDPVKRREFLRYLDWGAATLQAGLQVDAERLAAMVPGRVDRQMLDDLLALTMSHQGHMYSASPRGLLLAVRDHLGLLQKLLRAAHPLTVARQLQWITGEAAVVAGYLSYRLHNPGEAQWYYDQAEALSRQAANGHLRALSLVARSALYSSIPAGGRGGDSAMALALLSEAEAAAGAHGSPAMLTGLHARRAEDCAASGDEVATGRSLDRAEHWFSLVRGRNDGFFSNWSDGRMSGYRANAAALLNHPGEAAVILEPAVKRTPSAQANERCFLLIGLATARADEAQVDESCALLSEAFGIAQRAGLVERAHRVKGVRLNHLSRWERLPQVRQLDDQLRLAV